MNNDFIELLKSNDYYCECRDWCTDWISAENYEKLFEYMLDNDISRYNTAISFKEHVPEDFKIFYESGDCVLHERIVEI